MGLRIIPHTNYMSVPSREMMQYYAGKVSSKQWYLSSVFCADGVCVWAYFLNPRLHPLHSRWHDAGGGATGGGHGLRTSAHEGPYWLIVVHLKQQQQQQMKTCWRLAPQELSSVMHRGTCTVFPASLGSTTATFSAPSILFMRALMAMPPLPPPSTSIL